MSTSKSNTVILLFARRPKSEALAKAVVGKYSTTLWKKLYNQSILVLKKSGFHYLVIDETQQQGRSFGEKLDNAFQYAFGLGYAKVVAIGIDAPDLSVQNLINANELLHTNDWVIGPNKRGGTYLIGTTQKAFATLNGFSFLPWQSSRLLLSLIHILNHSDKQWSCLKPIVDLNSYADVIQWMGKVLQVGWIKDIMLVLFKPQKEHYFSILNHPICYGPFLLLRGPPV